MKWWARFGFIVLGLFFVAYGRHQMQIGGFVYRNAYRQPVFAAAVVVMGVFTICLAFLPNGDWVYRLITTKKRKNTNETEFSQDSRRAKHQSRKPN
jgi:hypothetical protein